MLHDEITIIDHALTPWTVTKNYRRAQSKQPIWWHEDICAEANVHVDIGGQASFLSADGLLMPPQKDPPPPGLRYFKPTPRRRGGLVGLPTACEKVDVATTAPRALQ